MNYKIIEKKDYSYACCPRISYKVLVKTRGIPTRKELISISNKIWKEHKSNYKEFTIFIYLLDMNINDCAYARFVFDENKRKEYEIMGYFFSRTKRWSWLNSNS